MQTLRQMQLWKRWKAPGDRAQPRRAGSASAERRLHLGCGLAPLAVPDIGEQGRGGDGEHQQGSQPEFRKAGQHGDQHAEEARSDAGQSDVRRLFHGDKADPDALAHQTELGRDHPYGDQAGRRQSDQGRAMQIEFGEAVRDGRLTHQYGCGRPPLCQRERRLRRGQLRRKGRTASAGASGGCGSAVEGTRMAERSTVWSGPGVHCSQEPSSDAGASGSGA